MKAHRFPCQTLLPIIIRIDDVELFLFLRRHAHQSFRETRQSIGVAYVQRHFVVVDRFGRAGNTFKRYHHVIAPNHLTRVDVHILRLLLAQLFQPVRDIFVGHFRLVILDLQSAIVL